ncbi:MAG: AmmeMemoRadiSam system protein B [Syntrophorhabdales bacterium]
MGDIREPYVSGTFYPRNPNVLRADIEGFLGKAPPCNVAGDIRGLISPHAGYMYSGQTAAHGYKAISGRHYDTVIILAPSHRSFFLGAAVQEKGAYRTPLGLVDIDEGLAGDLLKSTDMFHADPALHRQEHSLEVQLPFLQSVLRDFRILPLIMGSAQDPDSSLEMGGLIYEAIRNREGSYLIVGSSDLSHYYPYGLAVQMDKFAIGLIERFDLKGMSRELTGGKYEACGAGAILATMSVSEKLGAREVKVLDYKNSGDVSGEMSGVVGYVSCVFYGGK